jgi:hypothetical protein
MSVFLQKWSATNTSIRNQSITAETRAKIISQYDGQCMETFNLIHDLFEGLAILLEFYKFLCCVRSSVILPLLAMGTGGLPPANITRADCIVKLILHSP